MKLIIDIPEDVYIKLKDDEHMIRDVVEKFGGTASTQSNLAILNGTPYEERPKGKWIFDQEENVLTQTGEFVAIYHCSKCGKKIKTLKSYLSKNHCFCSVCGADMRGESLFLFGVWCRYER